MAGIERYREHEIQEGRKSKAYQVKPMDLSAGLSLGSAEKAGQAVGAGLKEFERTGWVISDIAAKNDALNRKIQAEKDELFGDKFRREYTAELKALPVTLDQEKDEAAMESIRKKYTEMLDQEKTISDNFRNKAGTVLDTDFSVYRIGMSGERSRTAVKQNAQQLKGFMDEAIGFGKTTEALEYRKRLESKGFVVASEESVRSACELNGLLQELPGMELTGIKRDIRMVEDAFKEKRGFLGMNAEHTGRYYRELLRAKRRGEDKANELFLMQFVDGNGAKVSESQQKAEYESGLIDEETYNKRMKMIQSWKAAQERQLRYSESQADKARKKADLDRKYQYMTRIKLTELGNTEENEAAFRQVVEESAQQFKHSPEIQYEILSAAKTHFGLGGKSSGGAEWKTDAGKVIRSHIDKAYKKDQFYTGWGWWKQGKDFQSARFLEAVNWAEGELRSGKGVDVIIKGFDDRMKELHSGQISAFLSGNFLKQDKPKKSRITREGETGRLKDGTRVIYRNGKWQRAE